MDLFDFSSVIEFAKAEPGHGLLQSVLLFMIWLQSKGLRKEVANLVTSMTEFKMSVEKRFEKIEGRVTQLEIKGV